MEKEKMSVLLCPYRIHSETTPSATMPNTMYHNEYFMPCLHENCPAYWVESTKYPAGNEIKREHCIRLEGCKND